MKTISEKEVNSRQRDESLFTMVYRQSLNIVLSKNGKLPKTVKIRRAFFTPKSTRFICNKAKTIDIYADLLLHLTI